MKIIGLGVDIIENKRIKSLIRNKKFISRIFSKKEILISKNINNKTNFFAKRFVAKEALSKAIGIGFRDKLNFKDISILNDKNGKPYYDLTSKLRKIIFKYLKINKFKVYLSLSDEKNYSIAFSIIQK